MRNVGKPKTIDTDQIFKLRKEGLTSSAIGKKLGCSQGYVSKVLTSAGLKTGHVGGANPSARANAQKIIDHIMKNGGSIREAMQKLELAVGACTVRTLAKDQGIDLMLYRHMSLTKGHWIVNRPYEKRATSGTSTPVPCKCQECGHETTISFQQLSNRNPPVCENCGAN